MELLDVVTAEGIPTGEVVERKIAHQKGIRHRTAHLWLLRKRNGRIQILLQKRSSSKDSNPSCYDISSAGHIPAGMDYIPSCLRELKEELGLTIEPKALHYCGQRLFFYQEKFHGEPFLDHQVSNVYYAWINVDPKEMVLQTSEVESVLWMDLEACIDAVQHNLIPHCIKLEELAMVASVAREDPMSITCVALDLDETTLDSHSHLTPANRDALSQLVAQGMEVVLASGRALHTYPKELLNFPGIRYAITSNGTSVVDLTTGHYVYRQLLTGDAVDTIMSVSSHFPVTYEAFLDGYAYSDADYVTNPEAYGAGERAAAYVRATRKPIEDIRGFISEHRTELDALDIIVADPMIKQQVWNVLDTSGAPIYITSSTDRLIEISHEGGGKGSALKFLLNKLEIDPAAAVAFGNGDNDADMLACCGLGIAVENATERCKAAAGLITKHHNEDGVAYALREYLHLVE